MGVCCRAQGGMQANSSKSQQGPSCKETPHRHMPSSPSTMSKAVQDAPRFWEIMGNGTTLVLTEAGEREPRQEGSPTPQAQHREGH